MTKRSMARLFGTTFVLLFAMGNIASASPQLQTEVSQVQSALVASSTPSSTAISIATGYWHSCAALTGSGAKCWGYNGNGQLGDGTTTQQAVPVFVFGLTDSQSAMAGGRYHTCTLTTTGGVKCWGNSNEGQLGNGSFIQSQIPVDVNGLPSGVSAIVTGELHTCALTTNGGVKCWGNNFYGQLGDGTTTNRNVPTDVIGLTSGVSTIAAGWSHTCALTTSGAVKCWGNNINGQLGDGTTTETHIPVQVSGLSTGVSGIAGGRYHTCAALTGGGAKCWGDNGSGQLGDGTTTQRLVPANVNGLLTSVTAMTAGEQHTCAVVNGGGAKCWGNNDGSQLGDGTALQRLIPVDVSGLTSSVKKIAAGWYHTCALMTGGSVKCWGGNGNASLGDGTTIGRATPVDVVGLGGSPIPNDITPPDITPRLSGTEGNNGWYTSNVTVSWIVNDPESGVASSIGCGTTTFAIDTAETTLTCSATNGGSLTSSRSVTLMIDQTPPAITSSRSPQANANGWNNTDVTVSFTCNDTLSGVAFPPISLQVVTAEGVGQSRVGTCTDQAGNLATATVSGINIDKTPPRILGSPIINTGTGWYRDDVTIRFTCTDALSGTWLFPPMGLDQVVTEEGAGQSVVGTCTDQAGNVGTATVGGINIDKTLPILTLVSRTPLPNAYGWNNTNVSFTFACTDALSGVQYPPQSPMLVGSGAGQTRVIGCGDKAGNVARMTISGINIEKTPPTITSLRTPQANADGWNNTDVTVTFTCTDTLSGVAVPPVSPQVVTAEGAGQSRAGTCTDKADNLAMVAVSGINIDITKPTISLTSPQANMEYPHAQKLNIAWTVDDVLSGIATQSATLDGNAVTNGQAIDLLFQTLGPHIVTVIAKDKAGNAQSASTTFTIKTEANSLVATVDRALELGWISKPGTADSLRSKLDAIKSAIASGQVKAAKNQLNAFLNELDAQKGKVINQQAYDLLKTDTVYLLGTLP